MYWDKLRTFLSTATAAPHWGEIVNIATKCQFHDFQDKNNSKKRLKSNIASVWIVWLYSLPSSSRGHAMVSPLMKKHRPSGSIPTVSKVPYESFRESKIGVLRCWNEPGRGCVNAYTVDIGNANTDQIGIAYTVGTKLLTLWDSL